MTDASAAVKSQPMKVSMKYAIDYMTSALARDEAHIAFPTLTFVVAAALGGLNSTVRDFLARNRLVPNIAYMRKKSGPGTATAATGSSQDNTRQ